MNTPARLTIYGVGLAATFGAAFLIAGALVPDAVVKARADATAEASMDMDMDMGTGEGGTGMKMGDSESGTTTALPGLSSAAGGFQLSTVSTPKSVGEDGELSFAIRDAKGTAVTSFVKEHEKYLHLIVVRNDGSQFRHVHPTMDDSGTWSIPWSWDEAGSYRIFADFTPSATKESLTLTRSAEVAGDYQPVPSGSEVREARVGEFDVRLTGDLMVGGSSNLTLEVSRNGKQVTELEPYLGAFGHLVALREGDLAYLHVHPEGDTPQPGSTSGPTVNFMTEAPTSGRYLLYFDFQVAGKVYSAPFALDASAAGGSAAGGSAAGGSGGTHSSGSH